jgi:hypothetical protein
MVRQIVLERQIHLQTEKITNSKIGIYILRSMNYENCYLQLSGSKKHICGRLSIVGRCYLALASGIATRLACGTAIRAGAQRPVISGFHSPLEQSVLKILLEA